MSSKEEQLRTAVVELGSTVMVSGQLMREATAEIERLREVNGELLAALKKLVSDLDDGLLFDIVVGNARAAIRKAESKPRLRDEGSSREDSFFERFER
jgi:hypothetical protein